MTKLLPLLFCLSIGTACATQAPADASEEQGIGYSSVSQALSDLSAKPENAVRVQEGWTIITDKAGLTTWSFTPADHPAHPAAIKRTTFSRDGTIYIGMKALCQAPKPACDNLIEQFKHLNERVRQHFDQQSYRLPPNNSFKPNPLRGSA